MNKHVSSIILCVYVLVTSSEATPLQKYISELFTRQSPAVKQHLSHLLKPQIKSNDISDSTTIYSLEELLFMHLLFTATDAQDGSTGGILHIPYFWHWVSPNPRHMITHLPTGTMLASVTPPEGYKKYKSYADIDRTPGIYLSNLFEEQPLFSHPLCRRFFTFGWCSEREMAYCSLLHILGYTVKIKQYDIHVWTEVLLQTANGEQIIAEIDNTFDSFKLRPLKAKKSTWKKDFGNGAQVAWYNKKAHAPAEIAKVTTIDISNSVRKRIAAKITAWIAGFK